MHIVQIAAEFAPLAKAGGLGEVIVGLSRELTRTQQSVEVILPKYDVLPLELLSNLKLEIPHFITREGHQEISNSVWSAEFENIQLRLIEMHHPANYFKRGSIYGFNDDVPRFLYFAKAAAEYLAIKQQPIDILHLHDWHAAGVALLARGKFKERLQVGAIALSIHNLEYQGKCGAHDLEAIEIAGEWLQACHGNEPAHPNSYNVLKGGITVVDRIIPVSPTYAHEILTPEFGFGLETVLSQYTSKMVGILNGIDQTLWNPATDPHLAIHFAKQDAVQSIFRAKQETQNLLSKRFGLKGAPWVGTITRLVPQKGPEFIEAAIEKTIEQGGVFALLGSSPIPEMQHHFEAVKARYQNHPQVLLHLTFDEALAHQLYAALDFILVPSHFEPCGLSQMIGMQYGAIPIVRSTGGLKDTVFDSEDKNRWNGFVFQKPLISDFLAALQRAFGVKTAHPEQYAEIMKQGLNADFSWQTPTQKYIALFLEMLKKKSSSS